MKLFSGRLSFGCFSFLGIFTLYMCMCSYNCQPKAEMLNLKRSLILGSQLDLFYRAKKHLVRKLHNAEHIV